MPDGILILACPECGQEVMISSEWADDDFSMECPCCQTRIGVRDELVLKECNDGLSNKTEVI